MSVATIANVLLIGAAVVWILARQIQVARVKPLLLLAAPVVLAYFGIRALPASAWHEPADLGLLAVSAAISIALGVWRGLTITVWRDADGTWWRQGSWFTLALWGALIAARGLLYGVDVAAGHREASGLGAVLITLALSFAAQNAVTAVRMNAAPSLPAGPSAEPAVRPGTVLPASSARTITFMPAGTNASRPAGCNDDSAAKRGAGGSEMRTAPRRICSASRRNQ